MAEILKAIRYRHLDEARKMLIEAGHDPGLLKDGEVEPQGLLAVVPEDRLPENKFYTLFDLKKGILIEVEKISYSGYGPPAEEEDYMGFVEENVAYVVKGCRLPIEIENCPQGAKDIHHLEAMILDREHPIDRQHLARQLQLSAGWSFEELFNLIGQGKYTAEEIDRIIHQGIQ